MCTPPRACMCFPCLCTLVHACANLDVLVHASLCWCMLLWLLLQACAHLCTPGLACPYISMLVPSCLCLCSLGLAGVCLEMLILVCASHCVHRHTRVCPFLHAWAPLVRGGHRHPVFPPPFTYPCWCSARPRAPCTSPCPFCSRCALPGITSTPSTWGRTSGCCTLSG